MRIAVDLDAPCYEWQRTVRYMLNEYRSKNLGPIEDWWTTWTAEAYITPEDYEWLWTEGVRLGLYRYGHVTTGAIVGLMRLVDAGHSLLVVSHRPAGAVPDTLEWLAYQKIPWAEVHILSNGEPKTSIDADILVDDRIENVVEWALAGRIAILFDKPWNQGLEASNVWRVHDWRGVTGVIGTL